MVTRAILYRGGAFSWIPSGGSLRYGVNQNSSPVSFCTSKSSSGNFLPFCNHSFRIEDFFQFARISYLLRLNIVTFSDLDLLLVGPIMSIPIIPSYLDNSLEIPESHPQILQIYLFFAIRRTITVNGSRCFSALLSSSSILTISGIRVLINILFELSSSKIKSFHNGMLKIFH